MNVSIIYCFINENINTNIICFFFLADIISAVEFDDTGKYLATGDKGGRVVLFEREDSVNFFSIITY